MNRIDSIRISLHHFRDVPPEVREGLRFVFVTDVDQVLEEALHPARSAATQAGPTITDYHETHRSGPPAPSCPGPRSGEGAAAGGIAAA